MPRHQRKLKIARHHSNHHIRLAVEQDLSCPECSRRHENGSCQVAGSSAPPPASMLIVFLLRKNPSQKRSNSQRQTPPLGHPRRIDRRRLIEARKLMPCLVCYPPRLLKLMRVARVVANVGNCHPASSFPPTSAPWMMSANTIRRSGRGNASSRSNTPSTIEKIAVVAPIPALSAPVAANRRL